MFDLITIVNYYYYYKHTQRILSNQTVVVSNKINKFGSTKKNVANEK